MIPGWYRFALESRLYATTYTFVRMTPFYYGRSYQCLHALLIKLLVEDTADIRHLILSTEGSIIRMNSEEVVE